MRQVQPKYFLLENVRMSTKHRRELDAYLGVEGIDINSELVSFQHRPRIYWTNIPGVTIPEDRHIDFQDYIEKDPEIAREYMMSRVPYAKRIWNDGKGGRGFHAAKNITHAEKIKTVTTRQDALPNSGLIACEDFCRTLTRREIEQAQTLPVGYTDGLSYRQMQDVVGNAWTVDVIAHIFSFIK